MKFIIATVVLISYWISSLARVSPKEAQLELGHRLFFEKALSKDGTKSCASCHDPRFAFTDRYRRGLGLYADNLPHNTPSLINVRFYRSYNWSNPEITTLETQMERPLFSQHPPEMGMNRDDSVISQRLAQIKDYDKQFKLAFPSELNPVSWQNIIATIAEYERTLVSFNAPFDRFQQGEKKALSESAKRGWALFKSSKLQCATCHPAPHFTDATVDSASKGFYDIGYEGTSVLDRVGTEYRTPSLRNVTLTAPYMHDGNLESLDKVIRFKETGGSNRRTKSSFVQPFTLTHSERLDLMNFLESLTDSTILTNPKFQTPKD